MNAGAAAKGAKTGGVCCRPGAGDAFAVAGAAGLGAGVTARVTETVAGRVCGAEEGRAGEAKAAGTVAVGGGARRDGE